MNSAEQVCRACLKESNPNDEFLDINTVNFPNRVSLRTKLKSCVPEVNIGDNESAHICTSCATLLESSYVFRNICLATEEKLRRISSAYYSDLVKIINKRPTSENVVNNTESRKLPDEDLPNVGDKVFRSADKNVTQKSFLQHSDDKQRYILDIEQNLAISIAPHKPHHVPNKNSVPQIAKDSTPGSSNTKGSKQKALTTKQIIAQACQTIPALSKHKPENLECSVLLEKIPVKNIKAEHYRDPETGNLVCRFCPRQMYKLSALIMHERRLHTKEKPYVCKGCNEGFYASWELKSHLKHSARCKRRIRKFANAPQTARKKTTMTTTAVKNLRKRNRFPQENREFDDMQPSSSSNFESFGALADALTSSTPITKVKSELPDYALLKEVKTEPGLEENSPSSSTNKIETSYACEFCTEIFEAETLRDKHLEIHSKFICHLCLECYGTKEERNTHIKQHYVEGKYYCFVCKSVVTNKDHFNIHTGKRPYICSTCQNSFNCSSSLSVHQWKHRNYRPYYCPHCKKGFVKRVTMIQHKTRCFEMKKSSSRKEETTFDCQTCNGKFSSNQLLEEHVCKNEKGELVFKCHVCKEMIVGRPEFIEHVRQRHFVEVAGNQ